MVNEKRLLIESALGQNDMTRSDLARRLTLPLFAVDGMIDGSLAIDEVNASKIGRTLSVPYQILLSYERKWQSQIAHQRMKSLTEEDKKGSVYYV